MPAPYRVSALPVIALCLATTSQAETQSDLGPFGENYALLANRMKNNGWTDNDEQAIRTRLSVKYTLFGAPYVPVRSRKTAEAKETPNSGWEIFVAYTGEFDFYLGTRDSGPVINRVNNPAIYGRVPLQDYLGNKDDNVYFSIEHRSNGQVGDVTSPTGRSAAAHAYRTGDRAFFDAVSRGSNFLAVTLELTDFKARDVDLRFKLRHFIKQESSVTWGPEAARGPSLNDYDRLTASASWGTRAGWFDAAWRLGDGLLRTDSWTFSYQFPKRGFPLFVQVRRGPMNTLSNYTQRQDSIGIGFRFARPEPGRG